MIYSKRKPLLTNEENGEYSPLEYQELTQIQNRSKACMTNIRTNRAANKHAHIEENRRKETPHLDDIYN